MVVITLMVMMMITKMKYRVSSHPIPPPKSVPEQCCSAKCCYCPFCFCLRAFFAMIITCHTWVKPQKMNETRQRNSLYEAFKRRDRAYEETEKTKFLPSPVTNSPSLKLCLGDISVFNLSFNCFKSLKKEGLSLLFSWSIFLKMSSS